MLIHPRPFSSETKLLLFASSSSSGYRQASAGTGENQIRCCNKKRRCRIVTPIPSLPELSASDKAATHSVQRCVRRNSVQLRFTFGGSQFAGSRHRGRRVPANSSHVRHSTFKSGQNEFVPVPPGLGIPPKHSLGCYYPAFGYQSSKRTSILVPSSAFWNAARSVGGLAR